ncbi:2-haloacid dehalogenase/putative hydrolase of the HAD superfamily [Caulobacter ginsengisoli]|uniref:2-haloacid dehalogenase/putative hydrolase of the HAD superfamily n=2 Tax=Caulobacter ginsengisoli TaxID=400775 RepID=A0ABU0ISS5_9CAUL|nr:2-haloacid dehalogenase/putative hydrolase of the HAD superfamily [Caulobacter ginsengisoli]
MTSPVGVLWDVGNVMVRWDPRTLYSKIFPEPAARDRFLSSVCTLAWHAETDRGVPAEDNTAALIARHPQHEAEIRAWWERWDEMFSGAIAETESAMHALAERGVPQFALTNMAGPVWPMIPPMVPACRHLKAVVVSGDEGLIKPDAAIYHLACERAGLRPEQLLFVDDSLANINAAAELGFHVHRFEDPAALRPALEAHGLL